MSAQDRCVADARVDLLVRAYGDEARAVAEGREAALRAAGYLRLAAEWAAIAATFGPNGEGAGFDGGRPG